MKRIQAEILIARPVEVVFDHLADMTRLAEWAPEDFVRVSRLAGGPVGQGSRFEYETTGAHAVSWLAWDTFDRPHRLAWSGPRVSIGPGWVEGRGDYLLEADDGQTRLRAGLQPRLGGLIRLLDPVVARRNTRKLRDQLARLKRQIEAGSARPTT
jgi:uncharacterized protein YndB with AHSA1/START domain